MLAINIFLIYEILRWSASFKISFMGMLHDARLLTKVLTGVKSDSIQKLKLITAHIQTEVGVTLRSLKTVWIRVQLHGMISQEAEPV